jgi:hypothetical protein
MKRLQKRTVTPKANHSKASQVVFWRQKCKMLWSVRLDVVPKFHTTGGTIKLAYPVVIGSTSRLKYGQSLGCLTTRKLQQIKDEASEE